MRNVRRSPQTERNQGCRQETGRHPYPKHMLDTACQALVSDRVCIVDVTQVKIDG